MEGVQLLFGIIPVVVILLYIFFSSFRILREYERAVIFRFGRRANATCNPGGDGSGPGLVLLIPLIGKKGQGSTRAIAMDVLPPDEVARGPAALARSAEIVCPVL